MDIELRSDFAIVSSFFLRRRKSDHDMAGGDEGLTPGRGIGETTRAMGDDSSQKRWALRLHHRFASLGRAVGTDRQLLAIVRGPGGRRCRPRSTVASPCEWGEENFESDRRIGVPRASLLK